MIAALHTPGRRIALAIALSLLIHAAILWLPYITLPQPRVVLPPLSVRLEPLPKPVVSIAEKPEHAKPAPKNDRNMPDHSVSDKPVGKSMVTMNKTEPNAPIQPFPKHLQLTFIVYNGEDDSRTGELLQRLDISDGRYALSSLRKTSGLASLRNNDRLIQASHGSIDAHGLQPDTYEVEEITSAGRRKSQSMFDHASGTIRFQDGSTTALPADAQDNLSFKYQLSQLSFDRKEFFTLPVGDTGQLQQYKIEIGTREDVDTPMGKLHTVHLRQMHPPGSAYFEIWLGLEYHRLPVQFREVDGSDKVTEEYVIAGIRTSDE
ncbi:MAG: DUF3108 domain-containing protein [Gallionella sp.]